MSDPGSAHVAANAQRRLTEQAEALTGLGGQEQIAVGFVRAATEALPHGHMPDNIVRALGIETAFLTPREKMLLKTSLFAMAMQLQRLGYDLTKDAELKIGHDNIPQTGLPALDHP